MKPTSPSQPSVNTSGFRVLVFCGFILAGALTVFIAMSLRAGDSLRAVLHAGLLWVTITLIERNLDNLAVAEGRAPRDGVSPGPDQKRGAGRARDPGRTRGPSRTRPARSTRNRPGARS